MKKIVENVVVWIVLVCSVVPVMAYTLDGANMNDMKTPTGSIKHEDDIAEVVEDLDINPNEDMSQESVNDTKDTGRLGVKKYVECESGESGCSCKYTDGRGIVDLTSLGTTNDSPRFKDVEQADGIGSNTFSFSACNGFSEGECEDAAVCMTTDESESEQIGDDGAPEFMYQEETQELYVAYIHRNMRDVSASEVTLECDESACDPTFLPHGMSNPHLYKFTLKTVCACPGLCTASGPTNCQSKTGSLSGGSILLISAVCLLFVYVIAGVAFNKVKKKETGTNIIPNKNLWKALPGLIKTGFLFSLKPCAKFLPQRLQYDKIN